MATNNAVNVGLSGATGTGTFVGSTSPTLVTPTLGVASATSINFGSGALANFVPETIWTPAVTFATPGDLTVVYGDQSGDYSQIGKIVHLQYKLVFTPTYTTASGTFQITGVPVSPITLVTGSAVSSAVTFNAGYTQIASQMNGSSSIIQIYQVGSNQGIAFLSTSTLTSGNTYLIYGSLTFLAI